MRGGGRGFVEGLGFKLLIVWPSTKVWKRLVEIERRSGNSAGNCHWKSHSGRYLGYFIRTPVKKN